jgi:hypothetical protein
MAPLLITSSPQAFPAGSVVPATVGVVWAADQCKYRDARPDYWIIDNNNLIIRAGKTGKAAAHHNVS